MNLGLAQLALKTHAFFQIVGFSSRIKLRCHERFAHAFTACGCVFKVITLIGSNQGNYFENATTCSKRMRKTLFATQLKWHVATQL